LDVLNLAHACSWHRWKNESDASSRL